jgi:glucose-6-phosphate 1-dehydrogenase
MAVSGATVDAFLAKCYYCVGQYHIKEHLSKALGEMGKLVGGDHRLTNRVFYMAIPPSRFHVVGGIIKGAGMSRTGWNRIVVEKPFGRDSKSCAALSAGLKELFREDQLFRIDHYLGKPAVRSIAALRRSNAMLAAVWSRKHVSKVVINWEEDIAVKTTS